MCDSGTILTNKLEARNSPKSEGQDFLPFSPKGILCLNPFLDVPQPGQVTSSHLVSADPRDHGPRSHAGQGRARDSSPSDLGDPQGERAGSLYATVFGVWEPTRSLGGPVVLPESSQGPGDRPRPGKGNTWIHTQQCPLPVG